MGKEQNQEALRLKSLGCGAAGVPFPQCGRRGPPTYVDFGHEVTRHPRMSRQNGRPWCVCVCTDICSMAMYSVNYMWYDRNLC